MHVLHIYVLYSIKMKHVCWLFNFQKDILKVKCMKFGGI